MTLTVAATPSYVSVLPQVQVTVSSSPAVVDRLRVYRTHEDGSRFPVLTDASAVISGSWSGVDSHAPFNQLVTYSAETDSQVSAESAQVMLIADGDWLVPPTGTDLAVLADYLVGPVGDASFKSRGQSFQVAGRRKPVPWGAPRGGREQTIVVGCSDEESAVAVIALLNVGGPILINRGRRSDVDLSWCWVLPGDVSVSIPGGWERNDLRQVSFSFVECEQPDSDVAPIWTNAEMAAAYPTRAGLTAAFATNRDVRLRNAT